jgi:nicotinate-nucleotide adenylyltransferase
LCRVSEPLCGCLSHRSARASECYNPSVSERYAILGGTFDPIHIGHLAIAEDVRWQLGLDHVIFIPAARQPLKDHSHVATAVDRLAMVRLGIADNPAFLVSDLEIRRGGRSYTVDTVATLRDEHPGSDMVFIAGADVVADLHRWYQIDRLLELCRFVFVGRPGYAIDLERLHALVPASQGRVSTLIGPLLDISATELRARRARGAPVRYQVPDAVLEYMEAHGLYRASV